MRALAAVPGREEWAEEETIEGPVDRFSYNNHFYKYYSGPCTWQDARAFCERVGGQLACIEDDEELKALLGYLEKEVPGPPAAMGGYPWIGATDEDREDEWTWINGASFDRNLFRDGKPDGGRGQNHAFLETRGLDDHPANARLAYLCEWE